MSPKDGRPIYYVPHHVVIRPERETTKGRIVFDASAQIENDVSLSDCIETGPALLLELVSILIRFREHRVAIMAVIQKIYLQVKLKKEDRDVFRFLWRDMDSGAPPRIMRMVTSTFWSKSMSHSGNSEHTISGKEELKGNSSRCTGSQRRLLSMSWADSSAAL